jgi:signal transduction histidine kinase
VNFYLLMPLASCIACSMLAVAVLARDTARVASRLAALVSICAAFWALCEVLWNSSRDPVAALWLIRLSSLGWMVIGPAILHLFLELTQQPLIRRPWLPAALYALPVGLAALDLTTPWIHSEAIRTSWGWGWKVGPLFALPFAMSTLTVAAGVAVGIRSLRAGPARETHPQIRWMLGGLLIPLLIASFTDGIAPLLGLQLPRLGATSITLLVGSVAWQFHRYGYSLLAPGAFATEILATLREGVALLRPDGRIHSVNAGMARLLGCPARALEGRIFAELVDVALPDPEQETPECECCLLAAGRDPVPVSIRTSLLRDKRGNAIGLVLVARDLREIASLRNRLIMSGRLASVGQLAAGIAHEINNPVAYVRANLGALSDILDSIEIRAAGDAALAKDLAEGQELIGESLDGVDRVAAIVRDVKGFSHAGAQGLERIEIHELLDSVLRVAAPQLRYGAPVVRDFAEVPPIRGSSQQLKQVFLNLLLNASQAVREREEIRIVTRCENGRVVVEVRDQGCGIPADQLDRIFDPFFTTKPVGEGTGLGLSISYQIVRAHHGDLTVESTPGRDTCARVELPAVDPGAD